jgi:peptide/nickel transport system substrate-binding protein
MHSDDPGVARLVDAYADRRIDRREFLRGAFALGLSLPAAAALLAACGGGEETAEQTPITARGDTTTPTVAEVPDWLTIRLVNDVSNMDPANVPTTPDAIVMNCVNEGLVTFKPNTFEVVNHLAETFTPSPDGLSFEFKLKEGIQFHSGYGELTAEDVKFSYERIAGLTKPKIESAYRGDWSPHLEEVQVTDTYSGTIVLKEPFAAIMRSTLPVGSGLVLSKKAVEERGDEYPTHPIGTGPYEFVSWTPNAKVVLKRFADYGGANQEYAGSAFPEIHFIPIQDDSASDIALQTGEIDVAQLSLQGIDRFTSDEGFQVVKRTSLDYQWIGMNMLHPKLADIRVRQAIRLAVDVPAIIEAAFEGKWTRATAIIPPGMGLGHWADAPVYDRDVDGAKALLEDAGVSGLELSFMFTDQTGSKNLAEIVQSNLADVGIELTLNQVDSATFYELGKNLRERELIFIGFGTQPDPSWSTVWFTCDQLDVWNWMYWCDEEYDRLHFAAVKEVDTATRNEMYIQMQRLWDEAAHTIWVVWPTYYFGARKGIEPAITPGGTLTPWAFKAV